MIESTSTSACAGLRDSQSRPPFNLSSIATSSATFDSLVRSTRGLTASASPPAFGLAVGLAR